MPSTDNCSICLDPFNTPAACIPCGHIFCRVCISQWHSLHGATHNLCPQCRCFISTIQNVPTQERDRSIGARLQLPKVNPLKAARQLRRYIDSLCQSWSELDPQVKGYSMVLMVLLLSFIIGDLQTPKGLFNHCIFPILGLCLNIVRELLCVVLLVVCRPLVCLGQCVLEVLIASCDIVVGLGISVAAILYSLVLIPAVLIGAVFDWATVLVIFLSEIIVSLIRMVFISCLIFMTLCFVKMTEQERTEYFLYFVAVLQRVRDRYCEHQEPPEE